MRAHGAMNVRIDDESVWIVVLNEIVAVTEGAV